MGLPLYHISQSFLISQYAIPIRLWEPKPYTEFLLFTVNETNPNCYRYSCYLHLQKYMKDGEENTSVMCAPFKLSDRNKTI
jgi:hypothetical protein